MNIEKMAAESCHKAPDNEMDTNQGYEEDHSPRKKKRISEVSTVEFADIESAKAVNYMDTQLHENTGNTGQSSNDNSAEGNTTPLDPDAQQPVGLTKSHFDDIITRKQRAFELGEGVPSGSDDTRQRPMVIRFKYGIKMTAP